MKSELIEFLCFGLLIAFCLFLIKAFNAAMFAWSLHNLPGQGFWFWWLKKFKGEI